MTKSITLILLLIVAILPLSCSSRTSDEQAQNAQQTQIKLAEDATITAQVKARLEDDELVATRKIEVSTENGIVSLKGTIADQEEEVRAEDLARNVEGVRTVHSFLKVEPEETAEGSIRDEIKKGTEKAGDKAEEIAKKTKNGIEEAGEDAKEGIEKIGEKTKDAAITAIVKVKLANDDQVEASKVNVDTRDQIVILNGTVSSEQEAERAIQIARSVKDVKMVRSNLVIESGSGT